MRLNPWQFLTVDMNPAAPVVDHDGCVSVGATYEKGITMCAAVREKSNGRLSVDSAHLYAWRKVERVIGEDGVRIRVFTADLERGPLTGEPSGYRDCQGKGSYPRIAKGRYNRRCGSLYEAVSCLIPKRRKRYGRRHPEDGDDDQQFDQRKATDAFHRLTAAFTP